MQLNTFQKGKYNLNKIIYQTLIFLQRTRSLLISQKMLILPQELENGEQRL